VQGKEAKLMWSNVWPETIWKIWEQRNDVVFQWWPVLQDEDIGVG